MKDNFDLNFTVDPSHDCVKFVKSANQMSFTQHSYGDVILRSNFCPSLISILFNTNNINSAVSSIEKFVKKAKDPSKIQFCIKIDNEKDFVKTFLKNIEGFKCNFIILSSPKGRGYIDLWQWINFLYKVSSRRSEFFLNISDEMHVHEKNWDKILEKYINFKPDGIFRLRTSVYKNRNYNTLFECGYAPDTTAIYSKEYLKIQGDFSPCFGPDNGQQFVAYYMATLNYPRHFQFSRDYVINSISFAGQGTNKGLKGAKKNERMVLNYLLWQNMFTLKHQKEYFQRARKIQIKILEKQFHDIDVSHNHLNERYEVKTKDEYGKNLKIFLSYKISKTKNFIHNLTKINFFRFHTGYYRPWYEGVFFHFYVKVFKKIPKSEPPKEPKNNNYLRHLNLYVEKTSLICKKFDNKIGFLKKICLVQFIFFLIGIFIFSLYFLIYFYQFKRNLLLINRRFKVINRVYFYQTKSHILTNNKLDQSKTIIVKGE